MIERFIEAVYTDRAGGEEPAVTRERLKARFAPGAARRMTQLGMVVGALLNECSIGYEDTLVYASAYGESRALEAYLESFPTPSPTLFQTSIHPSGVQQGLIGRQRSVSQVFPLSGGRVLVAQAALTALLAPSERVIWCGGEERGTWLRELGAASERTFGFALVLTRRRTSRCIGKLEIEQVEGTGGLELGEWFDALVERRSLDRVAAPGCWLKLDWQTV